MLRWYLSLILSIASFVALAGFVSPVVQQRLVVADYHNNLINGQQNIKQKSFDFNASSQVKSGQVVNPKNNINNIAIIEAALVAEQAVVSALSFAPNQAAVLEQLAMRYFSQSGWQDFMTEKLRASRKIWINKKYKTSVLVDSWPVVNSVTLAGKSLAQVDLSVIVNLYSKTKLLAKQPILIRVYMDYVNAPIAWRVVRWQSKLIPVKSR